MQQAGADIMRVSVVALNSAAGELWSAKKEVASIAVMARTAEAQKQALLWAVGAGVAAGLVLFPLLGAFAPGGSFLAAWATGNADRWQAGVSLIQVGSPERAAALAASSRLVNANMDALQVCADAAKKAGKEQKCGVVVQVPGQ